jgi:hypothetical protein
MGREGGGAANFNLILKVYSNAMSDRWDCIVIARRVREGADEVLVQWDCTWMVTGGWAADDVVEELLRRNVDGQEQVLVQWKCTWVPVADADPTAVEEFEERRIAEEKAVSVVVSKRRKRRRRGW